MSEADDTKSMGIIATKGTLDMAYPPLILASTAAAFGWNVHVFFTFWGLDILHKDKMKNLKVSPVGNPNLPAPMPNIVGMLPGMTSMTTKMMKKEMDEENVAEIDELVEMCNEAGVDMLACQMTADLFDYDEDDFVEGTEAGVGAATALEMMADCDIQLLV